MRKVLFSLAITSVLSSGAYAGSGAYIGLGIGNITSDSQAKIFAQGNNVGAENISFDFPVRLKNNKALIGKVYGGYEFEFPLFSLLTEVGFSLDRAEAKYGKDLILTDALDNANQPPVITSTRLKRKNTFSIGVGIKKKIANKLSVQVGVDLLSSFFEARNTGSADFIPPIRNVVQRKRAYGVAPWVGVSLDFGVIETGLRYQYSKYQTVKTSGEFVPQFLGHEFFSASSRVRPEYHSIMLTIAKKF
jgi:hypothetical protein